MPDLGPFRLRAARLFADIGVVLELPRGSTCQKKDHRPRYGNGDPETIDARMNFENRGWLCQDFVLVVICEMSSDSDRLCMYDVE